MTVGIFSKDETLYQRRRRPAGVGTWWSTCCTARPTWPAGCRGDPDGPENTNQRQLVLVVKARLEKSTPKQSFIDGSTTVLLDPRKSCRRAHKWNFQFLLKIFQSFVTKRRETFFFFFGSLHSWHCFFRIDLYAYQNCHWHTHSNSNRGKKRTAKKKRKYG